LFFNGAGRAKPRNGTEPALVAQSADAPARQRRRQRGNKYGAQVGKALFNSPDPQ